MCSLQRAPIFGHSLHQQQTLRQHLRGCKLRGCRSRGCKLRGCRSRGRQLLGCWPKIFKQLIHLFLHPPSSTHLSPPRSSLTSAPEYPAKGALGTPSLSREQDVIASDPPTTRRYPLRKRVPTNRVGYATQHLANVIQEERYAHHIAAFTANLNGPLEKTQLPSLRKLLK